MAPLRWRTRFVLPVAAVLALVVGIQIAQGKTANMIQRFGLTLVDHLPAPAPAAVAQPSGGWKTSPAAVATARQLTPVSLKDAQRQLSFPIRLPAWVPAGLTIRGAFVPGDGSVMVSYHGENQPQAGLGVNERPGSPQGGMAFPESAAQDVTVNGLPAVYVHGSWDKERHFLPEADSAVVSWSEDGFTFTAQYSGLGLSKSELLRVAGSLNQP